MAAIVVNFEGKEPAKYRSGTSLADLLDRVRKRWNRVGGALVDAIGFEVTVDPADGEYTFGGSDPAAAGVIFLLYNFLCSRRRKSSGSPGGGQTTLGSGKILCDWISFADQGFVVWGCDRVTSSVSTAGENTRHGFLNVLLLPPQH